MSVVFLEVRIVVDGALDIPLFNSLHLMREVDFAKQKTERKTKTKYQTNCFSPSVSLARGSSLVIRDLIAVCTVIVRSRLPVFIASLAIEGGGPLAVEGFVFCILPPSSMVPPSFRQGGRFLGVRI